MNKLQPHLRGGFRTTARQSPSDSSAKSLSHGKDVPISLTALPRKTGVINGKTARADTKIVVARTPQVGMAGKQENRSVMESFRWLATTNFLDHLRRVFADEERILTAKVPGSHNRNCFSKS